MRKVSIFDQIKKKLKVIPGVIKNKQNDECAENRNLVQEIAHSEQRKQTEADLSCVEDKSRNRSSEHCGSIRHRRNAILSVCKNTKISNASKSNRNFECQVKLQTSNVNNINPELFSTQETASYEELLDENQDMDKTMYQMNPFEKYRKKRRKQQDKTFEFLKATTWECSQRECKVCNIEMLLPDDWRLFIKSEFEKRYFSRIKYALHGSESFFPAIDRVFYFSSLTRLSDLKVVILGQDPYHTPGKANGLAFSIAEGHKIPPSLRIIYEELAYEYPDFVVPQHGDLSYWAKQGVLLLNNILTVTKASPLGHSNIGWELFTTEIVSRISDKFENVVFMLWGSLAKSKGTCIDRTKHLVLEADHPNSFGTSSFKQCLHFTKCNSYLKNHNKVPIDWQV